MINREELKSKIVKYSADKWQLPENVIPYSLVKEMCDYIGDIDPYLRDNLIYEGLFNIIYIQRKLTSDQLKELTNRWIGQDFLFKNINEVSDSVYTRTFTILSMVGLIAARIEDNTITKSEFDEVFDKIIEYMKLEKDFRDYDSVRGWGHSVAHTGDLLAVIVQYRKIDKEQLIQILEQIKERATIKTHGYVFNEDERQINTVERIIKSKVLSDDEILAWINSFDEYSREGIFPDRFLENTNRKNFLRCLYFRFINGDYNKAFVDATKTVLDNMKKLY